MRLYIVITTFMGSILHFHQYKNHDTSQEGIAGIRMLFEDKKERERWQDSFRRWKEDLNGGVVINLGME